jgi:hypothetical protein
MAGNPAASTNQVPDDDDEVVELKIEVDTMDKEGPKKKNIGVELEEPECSG